MPRIRTIKPELPSSEQVALCTPTARLLFVLMLCFCDDNGIHPSSMSRLRMEVFPGDKFTNNDVRSMVDELIKVRLLEEYTVDGQAYLRVTGFIKHQRIDRPNYRHPLPKRENSTTIRRSLDTYSPPEEKRGEQNGMERNRKETEEKGGDNAPVDPRSTATPTPTPDFQSHWETFLNAYPKRTGSLCVEKGRELHIKLQRDGLEPKILLDGVNRYRAWCDATSTTGTEYVKQITSWLNQRCWNERWDIPAALSGSPKRKPDDLEFRKKPALHVDYELAVIGQDAYRVYPGTKTRFDEAAWCAERGLDPPDSGSLRMMRIDNLLPSNPRDGSVQKEL